MVLRSGPRPIVVGALVSLALVVASAPAPAQILNVQPLLAREAEEGLSGAVDGSADWRGGNVDLLLLSGSVVGRLLHGPHLVFLMTRAEIGRQGDARFVNRDIEHLRYRYAAGGPWFGEVFVQHDRDEFRRLALRALWGAGPRVESSVGAMRVAAGMAYMMELEELQGDEAADAGLSMLNHRVSSYAMVTIRVAERIRLGHTFYVQPRIDRPADVRLLADTELVLSASAALSMKIALSLAFDSEPPAGVQAVDGIRKASLQLNF